MESSADSLMNEVFEELDQLLDGTERVRATIEPDDYGWGTRLDPIVNDDRAMPLVAMPEFVEPPRTQAHEMDVMLTQPVNPMPPRRANSVVDRLMVLTAIASILATAAVGWLNRQDIQQFVATATRQQAPSAAAMTADPQVAADLQFISYLQRSLETINSTAAKSNGLPVATNPNTGLPTLTVNGNLAQPSIAPTVLERIYIPVYQPPQAFYLPPNAQLPTSAANPAARTSAVPVAPAPAIAAAPSPAITDTITLVGVLELGKKSAVLFEVNGVPQRFYAGESIGNSGWTLVKITGQEAVIRRNGEVRSIYVGQKL
jgi:hypothetical protein